MIYAPNSNKVLLTYGELVPAIISDSNYRQMKTRGKLIASCAGGNGRMIYVEFDSLPENYRTAVVEMYGDLHEFLATQPLRDLLVMDKKAWDYYNGFRLPDGRELSPEKKLQYARQCEWLNAIDWVMGNKKWLKENLHISVEQFWDNIVKLAGMDTQKPELPTSVDRMRRKYKAYKRDGYGALVETWRFCNDHARKVTDRIENLLLSLYCRYDKPYLKLICLEYLKFMAGEMDVFDLYTGEVLNREDFMENGQVMTITEQTVHYYIHKPINEAAVMKYRMSKKQYNDQFRPHMRRIAPDYAFSKVTMDDTSSPFKMHNGKRPATYKMFDVASQAILCQVFNPNDRPTQDDIRELFRELVRLAVKNGWGLPQEIEVEHALNRGLQGKKNEAGDFEGDILTMGNVIPIVNFCAPKNPQQKRAEHIINRFKYDFQKRRPGFQHRPFAKREANLHNEDNDKVTYDYEQIVQMEMEDIMAFNNSLHPDQKKYPGLTRWQVLEQHQNPNLRTFRLREVIQWIGQKTRKTTLYRGELQIRNNYYRLPDLDVLKRIDDNEFTAYWLPDEHNIVDTIYLFQDGEFVTEAKKVTRFQEAKAEMTDTDHEILAEQRAYRDGFDKLVNERSEPLTSAMAIKKVEKAPVKAVEIADTIEITEEMQVQKGGRKRKKMPENDGFEGGYDPKVSGYVYDPQEAKRIAAERL